MPAEPAPKPPGKIVTADTLTVAPAVLGQPLATPWQRLGGMAIDLAAIGALSWLAKPFLGLTTGAMLIVLFGNSAKAPTGLRVCRTVCRVAGLVLIALTLMKLAKASSLLPERLHLEALTQEERAVALPEVTVSPNANAAELRAAYNKLSHQVDELQAENKRLRTTPQTLVGRTEGTIKAMGVTFGWAGVYFTLIAGLTNGRSLGKFVVRTRVVKVNGTPLKFFDAFIRQGGYVAGVAMGLIGFLKLLWEPNRQAVEDRIASTLVVQA